MRNKKKILHIARLLHRGCSRTFNEDAELSCSFYLLLPESYSFNALFCLLLNTERKDAQNKH